MLRPKKIKAETDKDEKMLNELKDIKKTLSRIEVILDNTWRERLPGGE